jgi:hypothetical protein
MSFLASLYGNEGTAGMALAVILNSRKAPKGFHAIFFQIQDQAVFGAP